MRGCDRRAVLAELCFRRRRSWGTMPTSTPRTCPGRALIAEVNFRGASVSPPPDVLAGRVDRRAAAAVDTFLASCSGARWTPGSPRRSPNAGVFWSTPSSDRALEPVHDESSGKSADDVSAAVRHASRSRDWLRWKLRSVILLGTSAFSSWKRAVRVRFPPIARSPAASTSCTRTSPSCQSRGRHRLGMRAHPTRPTRRCRTARLVSPRQLSASCSSASA